MPRGAFNIYFASNRHGYVRAEEWVPLIYVNISDSGVTAASNKHPDCDFPHRTVGIVLLVVILAALFVLGCWYFKKRSGYKLIRVSPSRLPVLPTAVYIGLGFVMSLRHSVLFQVPNAPPAYEKIASGPLPPPYSP
uniref:Melan-A n=1 Tax=Takifugu rubripes TaxID=31033 RepID=A0A3B5KBF3_TAKRU